MLYRCERTCLDGKGRYRKKGELCEFDEGTYVPKWFVPVVEPAPAPEPEPVEVPAPVVTTVAKAPLKPKRRKGK